MRESAHPRQMSASREVWTSHFVPPCVTSILTVGSVVGHTQPDIIRTVFTDVPWFTSRGDAGSTGLAASERLADCSLWAGRSIHETADLRASHPYFVHRLGIISDATVLFLDARCPLAVLSVHCGAD